MKRQIGTATAWISIAFLLGTAVVGCEKETTTTVPVPVAANKDSQEHRALPAQPSWAAILSTSRALATSAPVWVFSMGLSVGNIGLAAGLADNGGPTETIALQGGGFGNALTPLANCTDQSSPTPQSLTTDQRCFSRPAPSHPTTCSAGAFEDELPRSSPRAERISGINYSSIEESYYCCLALLSGDPWSPSASSER